MEPVGAYQNWEPNGLLHNSLEDDHRSIKSAAPSAAPRSIKPAPRMPWWWRRRLPWSSAKKGRRMRRRDIGACSILAKAMWTMEKIEREVEAQHHAGRRRSRTSSSRLGMVTLQNWAWAIPEGCGLVEHGVIAGDLRSRAVCRTDYDA